MADPQRAAAVVVERACKFYGRENDPDCKVVLQNLDMLVERGTIYGLLGASGCGKTTLLSCMVGRRRLDSGDIYVLGGRPGERGSGVPGPRVGYMPQDIALVAEFSVRDAVFYFGRIFGMNTKQMEARFEFLSTLLELPPATRLLKNLSGGQQRRVSFAAALVQGPELLILDEPTVGLDPVLRETIWEYLVTLAREGTTVIITTHYIEETKQADKIGLLRDGRLLAEESPAGILRRFGCSSLEDAFLALATRQDADAIDHIAVGAQVSPDVIPALEVERVTEVPSSQYASRDSCSAIITDSTHALSAKESKSTGGVQKGSARGRYRAVFIKSMQQFARHPGGLIFSMMFPIIQLVAFFSAIGHDPRDLHLAFVNDETANSPYGLNICHNSSLVPALQIDEETCDLYMLSCWFIDAMEESNLHQVPYKSVDEALRAVRDGVAYGALHAASNFSAALSARVRETTDTDNATVDASTIRVWLDMTNHQVSYYIKTQLYLAYERFSRRAMVACGRPADLVQVPVRFEKPVFGESSPQFSAFMAPGIMMTILFFLAAVVTSTLLISDRLEGVWERSAVAGVKPHELLAVHIVIHSTVILAQTLELLALAFLGYGMPYRGPMLTIGTLLFLQGLSGMCYGFLLSVCCSSYTVAFFISTGSFYPMVLLCGILWPLEGMSAGLRGLALTLPFTVPSSSLRAVMDKGLTVLDSEVYGGFLVTLVWISILLGLCLLTLRYKKN